MSFDNANAALAVVTAPRRDHTKAKRRISETRLFRRHGIAVVAILALIIWTLLIWIISGNISAAKTKKTLTAKYDAEYEVKMQAFKDELIELNTPTQDELFEKQLRKEADAIAKAIGTMNTKQMKLSMLWNILMRVDSPYYPDSVAEVIAQPSQWMFYKDSNPIRDDDVQLALEQLRLWHEGRYPAGLSSTFVYGEWSEHDYVLRDTWDKTYKTNYWRMPE